MDVNEVFPITLQQCDPKLNSGRRTLHRDKTTWGFENYPPPSLPHHHGERGVQGPSSVKFVKFMGAKW